MKKELGNDDNLTVNLRTEPKNKDSQTYKKEIPFFDGSSPEEYIKWQEALEQAIVGQNIQDGAQKHEMAKRLLKGGSSTTYNNILEEIGSDSSNRFSDSLKRLADEVFPKQALQM